MSMTLINGRPVDMQAVYREAYKEVQRKLLPKKAKALKAFHMPVARGDSFNILVRDGLGIEPIRWAGATRGKTLLMLHEWHMIGVFLKEADIIGDVLRMVNKEVITILDSKGVLNAIEPTTYPIFMRKNKYHMNLINSDIGEGLI